MILTIIISISIFFLFIEFNHKFMYYSPLTIKPKEYKQNISDLKQKYITLLEIINTDNKMEVMIPIFKVKPYLYGIDNDLIKKINVTIKPLHPDEEIHKDDYWTAYILKSKKSTNVQVEVEVEFKNSFNEKIQCLWLDIEWVNYGPFGNLSRFNGFAIPTLFPKEPNQKTSTDSFTQPIKTHILGSLDDPINVLKTYLPKDYTSKDILTIGESPLAIMQGEYIDYRSISVSLIARFLCKGFQPTSSLATACGMQVLINIYGPSRVLISWLIGGVCKLFGIKGMFYRLAGEQARLIDDITGTTPPYDKNIVLGPKNTKSFCLKASKFLGVDVAVVDVNDLGRVKILSTNKPSNIEIIKRALSSNPAGNANEQTPLVLIRPDKIKI